MLDNEYVRLANNWLHDVATGLWAACLIVLVVFDRQQPLFVAAGSKLAWRTMADTSQLIFWLLLGALAVIAVTGAVRLVYWRKQTPPAELPGKRKALIGKHVAFLVVYGLGTWWASTLVWP